MTRAVPALLAALALLAAGPARAGAELILQDGQVLSGTDVERTRDGVYLLTQPDDTVLAIPVGLVKKLVLTGGEEPSPTGFKVAVPENLVGPREPFEPPKTREQLEAFGRAPAAFRKGAVPVDWVPGNALGPDVSEFNPVRWFKAPTEFVWTPKSAFKASGDVTEFSPAKWRTPLIDPAWWPKSGFRSATRWFE